MSILFQAHGGGSAEQIDLGEDADDADHMITAEEGLRVAMARQQRACTAGRPGSFSRLASSSRSSIPM